MCVYGKSAVDFAMDENDGVVCDSLQLVIVKNGIITHKIGINLKIHRFQFENNQFGQFNTHIQYNSETNGNCFDWIWLGTVRRSYRCNSINLTKIDIAWLWVEKRSYVSSMWICCRICSTWEARQYTSKFVTICVFSTSQITHNLRGIHPQNLFA